MMWKRLYIAYLGHIVSPGVVAMQQGLFSSAKHAREKMQFCAVCLPDPTYIMCVEPQASRGGRGVAHINLDCQWFIVHFEIVTDRIGCQNSVKGQLTEPIKFAKVPLFIPECIYSYIKGQNRLKEQRNI